MKTRDYCRVFVSAILSIASAAAWAADEPAAVERAAAPDRRLPVPEQASIDKASQLLKEVFKDDYAELRLPEGRAKLIEKLIEQSKHTQDDPASSFAMLTEATKLATEGGEFRRVEQISDLLGERFAVDPHELLALNLERMAVKPLPAESKKALVEAALRPVDELLNSRRIELARRLANIAQAAARKSKDSPSVKRAAEVNSRVTLIEQLFEAKKRAGDTLAKSPDDPAANLAMGKYLCFVETDLKTGLPHLAKGNDATLKELAVASLQHSQTAEAIGETADRWWTAAEKARGTDKSNLKAVAAYFYAEALHGLTGLAKLKAEQRINELRENTHNREGLASGAKVAEPRRLARNVPIPQLDVLFRDEFDNPSTGWGAILVNPPGKPPWFGYERGHFFVARTDPGTSWIGRGGSLFANFVCVVTGHVTGDASASWGLGLQNSEHRFLIRVSASNDQRVTIQPIIQPGYDQAIKAGPFVHSQLHQAGDPNTLAVTVRGLDLNVYANGAHVCGPLKLPDVDSFQPKVTASTDAKNATSTFERLAIYALPESEERDEEIACQLSRGGGASTAVQAK